MVLLIQQHQKQIMKNTFSNIDVVYNHLELKINILDKSIKYKKHNEPMTKNPIINTKPNYLNQCFNHYKMIKNLNRH
jgi:hypothetical protein